MVFDSRAADVAKAHRGMVQVLKEKRAEAHFAGINLEQAIQVYDWSVPAHASALRGLGLTADKVPALCLVSLNGRGLPERVTWQSRYSAPDQAIKELDLKLGIAGRDMPKTPPIVMLVGSETAPTLVEADAKLSILRKGDWSQARIDSIQKVASLTGVPNPGLAMVDPTTKKVLWTRDLTQADSAIQALAVRLSMAYKIPEQLQWKDGTVLLRVPGGTVTLGNDQHNDDSPRHPFNLNEPYYYLGKTEVTVGQFRKFVQANGNYRTDCEKTGRSHVFLDGQFRPLDGAYWEFPRGPGGARAADNWPVAHISQNDAIAYCVWAGLRLPTEREWEHAAGSKDFPWGDKWNSANCRNSADQSPGAAGGPAPVGSYPSGASPFGLLDMAGNVFEWTSSLYLPYTVNAPTTSRMNGLRKVVRGGSWGDNEVKDYWVSKRTGIGAQDTTEATGFRVCLGGPQDLPQP
ncbi:MAG: SUMF1/EgtB/PvdO family nonheme iron enzyme [Candidatus Eremiobacteraeota bacterium]|nr:SUMF1/EgtB/PvdO family nonheme iron enzyme [Candidatus Eremiobacteraeota bacterium]